jgi:hypothetical protein
MTDDRDLHVRIQGEYQEMPGLKLTLPQASRLFNVDLSRCALALDTLVANGQLRTDGRAFVHARGGRQYC